MTVIRDGNHADNDNDNDNKDGKHIGKVVVTLAQEN